MITININHRSYPRHSTTPVAQRVIARSKVTPVTSGPSSKLPRSEDAVLVRELSSEVKRWCTRNGATKTIVRPCEEPMEFLMKQTLSQGCKTSWMRCGDTYWWRKTPTISWYTRLLATELTSKRTKPIFRDTPIHKAGSIHNQEKWFITIHNHELSLILAINNPNPLD